MEENKHMLDTPANEAENIRPDTETVDGAKKRAPAFIYALLAAVMGYLFVRWTFGPTLGIGAFVFTCLFLLYAVSYRAVHGKGLKKFTPADIVGMLVILLLGGVQLVSDNASIKFVCYYVEIHAALYWLLHFFGNREAQTLDGDVFLDSIKAIWVMPFGSFGKLFGTLFSADKENGKRGAVGYVVIGLLLAMIPTMVVLMLLTIGDSLFEGFVDYVLNHLTEDIFENVFRILLAVPVSMYIFGAFWSGGERRFPQVLNREAKDRTAQNCRFLHPVISCTAALPVIALYVIYVVLHIGYYFSAFQNIVPKGYSTAVFARQGFFELCIVACINLGIIAAGTVFTKRRKDGQKTCAWRTVVVVMAVMTLALSASAVSKMLLYIRLFGLTMKRTVTMWIMLFLILTFVYIIIRQFTSRFPVWSWTIATGLVMLFMLGYANADALVARYNINAWKQGKLEELDVQAIGELSDAVTPSLLALAEEGNKQIAREAKDILYRRSLDEKNAWCYENLTSIISHEKIAAFEKALAESGQQDKTHLKIKLVSHIQEEIAELRYAYYRRGELIESGGVMCADGSGFRYGDAIWLEEVFDAEMATDMMVELSVVFSGEEEYALGTICPSFDHEDVQQYVIVGDRSEGFRTFVQ